MEITEITIKKIIPKEGFVLTDGEIITDAIFVKNIPDTEEWWEIPNIKDNIE